MNERVRCFERTVKQRSNAGVPGTTDQSEVAQAVGHHVGWLSAHELVHGAILDRCIDGLLVEDAISGDTFDDAEEDLLRDVGRLPRAERVLALHPTFAVIPGPFVLPIPEDPPPLTIPPTIYQLPCHRPVSYDLERGLWMRELDTFLCRRLLRLCLPVVTAVDSDIEILCRVCPRATLPKVRYSNRRSSVTSIILVVRDYSTSPANLLHGTIIR